MAASARLFVLFVATCITSGHSETQFINSKCIQRSFGSDSIVCVCSGIQCDKIPPVPKPSNGSIVQITSSLDGLRFAKTKKNFGTDDQHSPSGGGPTIQVRRETKFQEIIGFGGAFTDAAAINIKSLPKETQELLIRSYFASDGIEYNMGRVPIAGSDFSTHIYSYADQPSADWKKNFQLKKEDLEFKIPVIKLALSVMPKPDELFLSAASWSSPPWMKTSNSFVGFGLLKQEFYQAYADYLLMFLDSYAKHNLKFWSLSTGNEPLNGIFPILRFNSLGWLPSQQGAWIRNNLGPSLRRSVHNQTKLLSLDDQRLLLHYWVDWLLEDKETLSYVDGIGVHWYTDFITSPRVLDSVHEHFPNKFLLYTEACVGSNPWEHPKVILGSWHRAEQVAEDMISVLNHWVTGWIDWNLALAPDGGPNWIKNFVDSPIIVNATSGEFFKQPMFYAIGHFSKFVPRKSVRIEAKASSQNASNLFGGRGKVPLTVAFLRPDGTVAVIIMNKSNSPLKVSLDDSENGSAVLDVPARSISTVLYR